MSDKLFIPIKHHSQYVLAIRQYLIYSIYIDICHNNNQSIIMSKLNQLETLAQIGSRNLRGQ